MNDALHTFIILALITAIVIAMCEIARLIHAYRLRVNRVRIAELEGERAKLATENDALWTRLVGVQAQADVHALTIGRLERENEALEAENRMLMDSTKLKQPLRVSWIKH